MSPLQTHKVWWGNTMKLLKVGLTAVALFVKWLSMGLIFSVKIQYGKELHHRQRLFWRESDPQMSKYNCTKFTSIAPQVHPKDGKEQLTAATAVTVVGKHLKSSLYCWNNNTFNRKKVQLLDHLKENLSSSSSSAAVYFQLACLKLFCPLGFHNYFVSDNLIYTCAWPHGAYSYWFSYWKPESKVLVSSPPANRNHHSLLRSCSTRLFLNFFLCSNEEFDWIWALVAGLLGKGRQWHYVLRDNFFFSLFVALRPRWDMETAPLYGNQNGNWNIKYLDRLPKRHISHKDTCFWCRMAANTPFCDRSLPNPSLQGSTLNLLL